MDNAESILVIITASLLALTLLFGIALIIALFRLIKSVKRIVAKAEGVVDSAETVADAFKNVKGPLAFIKLVNNIVSIANKHKK